MKNHEIFWIFHENQSETVKHKNAQEKPWHQKTLSMINDWVQIIAFIVAMLNVCSENICNALLRKKYYRCRIATEIWPSPNQVSLLATNASLNKMWTFSVFVHPHYTDRERYIWNTLYMLYSILLGQEKHSEIYGYI